MYIIRPRFMNEAVVRHLWGIKVPDDPPMLNALRLFKYARFLGWFGQIQSKMSGVENRLIDLEKFNQKQLVSNWRYIGVRTVIIDHIIGSCVYTDQFDPLFYPKTTVNKARWISVAAARIEGSSLPLVDLIKVKGSYFIQEGIHRVSVARTIGDVAIKGYITLWDINDDASLPIPRDVYHAVPQSYTAPCVGS